MAKPTGTMPTYDQMLWPALVALKEAGGSSTNQEMLDRVVKLMAITEEVQVTLHKDGPATEVSYRLAWARTYLKKGGAVENSSKGVWNVTPSGAGLSEAEVVAIPGKLKKGEFGGGTDQNVDEEVKAEEGWKEQLLKVLKEMPPNKFEHLAQRLLRESGFVKVDVIGKSGDGGIDGVGVLRLNLISFQVFFQCKRYKDAVGSSTIRDFRGAMVGRTDKGLVITTGHFTPEAKKEASRDGAPPVELIDGEQRCDHLKHLRLGVKTELVEHVTVEPDFFRSI